MRRAAALLGLVCLFGCAGDLEDPARFAFLDPGAAGGGTAGTAGSVMPAPLCVTQLFDAKCNSSICHGAGSDTLDLISANVAERLVNQAAPSASDCGGRTYVTTDGSPSLLIQKLSETPPCGLPMPLTGSATDDEKACVDAWITAVGGAGAGGS